MKHEQRFVTIPVLRIFRFTMPSPDRRAERAGPGRPRSREADTRILAAVLELLAEQGLEGLSMDGVATRAGVGKATIYRRWSSRQEMVAAALRSLTTSLEVPDTGSVRNDLVGLIRGFRDATLHSLPRSLRPRLIALTLTNADLMEIFHSNVYVPRRAALLHVLERGLVRGELQADLNIELAALMIHGPMFQLALLGEAESLSSTDTPSEVVDMLLQGISS